MSELPRGWVSAKIGDLCHLTNGRVFKPSDWTESGLPIVRIQNLNNPKAPFNHYDGEVRCNFLIEEGELLFAWSGTPGTSFGAHVWGGGRAVLNQHIFKVEFPADFINKFYLRYAINQSLQHLIDVAHGGVGLRHVTKGEFQNTEIPLPPAKEQDRIVAKLDSIFERIRRAREALSHIPRLIDNFKNVILNCLFPLDDSSGDCWPELAVSELAETVFDGPFGSNLKTSDYVSQGVRVVRLENIGHLIFRGEKEAYVSEQKYSKLSRHTLYSGDIVFSSFLDEEIRVCQIPVNFSGVAINKADCFCIRCNKDLVDPEFLVLRLASAVTYHELKQLVHGCTRPRVALGQLKRYRIQVPPLDVQRQMVVWIKGQFDAINRIAADCASSERLLDHLDQANLAKAFRGELVPQDPNDEPASVLLERIRAGLDHRCGHRNPESKASALDGQDQG